MNGGTCAIVLVKSFGDAKQRLAAVLDPAQRRELARGLAGTAITAATAADSVLVVAGDAAAAAVARAHGVEVVVEPAPSGQNPAAAAGIAWALRHGSGAVLLLSSDLPLVRPETVRRLLDRAAALPPPCAVAAAATGRGGTNALFLRPPGALGLHFGDDSLRRFAADARSRGVAFAVHEDPELALDLDEPSDLAAWRPVAPAV